jgi:signal transduction histidine kinase
MSDDLAELKARHARLEQLYQVSQRLHSTLEPQAALTLLVRETVRLVRATSGSVATLNPTNGFLEIEASHGLPASGAQLKLRIGEGITGWVARTGKPACVGDIAADPRYLPARAAVRSELAVPLLDEGVVRGVLNVDSDRLAAFTVADQELLEALAVHAVLAIRNIWRHERLRQRARLFESLASVSQAVNSTLHLDDALRVVTREAGALMGAKMVSIQMLDDTGENLVIRASHGAGQAYRNRPPLALAESFHGTVIRRRKPMQVENVQESGLYQQAGLAREAGLLSLIAVPLLFNTRATGVLSVYTGEPHVFSNEEIAILAALAELSAIAIEKARLYERIVDLEAELRRNEKLSALGLLAAEVAHEIRNPLTVMKLLYHSLDLQFPTGDPRAKDARLMGEKMDHLNKIVERILAFARTAEPQFAEVDLNRLLDDLALLTRHKLSHQGVELVRRLADALPLIRADATQLEQAFLNLTLNAAEAMPHGGRLTLTTRAKTPRGATAPTHVILEFADTGAGMTAEQQRRAFTSLLSTTKAKGTGLGLAIVAKIVEAHRGEVKVRSKPGKGTTIRMALPV